MFAPKDLDREKCIKMALVHDVAEAVIGDITPVDERYTKAQKYQMEEDAFKDITKNIGAVGEEMVALWKELELRETAEAKFVKDLDRLDWIYTAATGDYNTDLARSLEAEILEKDIHLHL